MNQEISLNKIKVAVIGYGYLGKWHCEKVELCNDAKLIAIIDSNKEKQEAAKLKHPSSIITSSLEEVIDLIDAAFIVAPTSEHQTYIEKLLKAKKHIFCEKPLVSNFSMAKDVEAQFKNLTNEIPLTLQVGHSERYQQAIQIIQNEFANYISEASILKMSRLTHFKNRAIDVDVVSDLMIHDIDLMLALWKEFPISVIAKGHRSLSNHWDFVHATFHFASGKMALLQSQRDYHTQVRQLEFIGAKGQVIVDFYNTQINIFNSKSGELNSQKYESRDLLLLEHQEFYQSIKQNRPPLIGLKDGLLAVYLAQKVLTSLESSQLELIDESTLS